ncbi:MAG: hypothetical protein QNJ63_21080 [Calothrix sp. MO_192.B10]|nr:hypothetical protein [Calothrix sp. MO_192.B10]
MTHPTVWNRKANFKVVRLAAATSENTGKTQILLASYCCKSKISVPRKIELPVEDGRLPGFSHRGDKGRKTTRCCVRPD